MDLDTITSTMLNGEPIHDGIVIGTVFIAFIMFYKCIFGAMFSIFKRN